MLLEKDKHCCCPNCGCKSFKDISIINVIVTKDEWNDDMLTSQREVSKYKCTRCGKEFAASDLYEHWLKQG